MKKERVDAGQVYVDLINKIKKIESDVDPAEIEELKRDVDRLYTLVPDGASSDNRFALASDISAIDLDIETLSASVSAVGLDVAGINSVIPSGATSTNQLVTKGTVNNKTVYQLITPLGASYWEAQAGGGYKQSLYCTGKIPTDYIPTIFIKPEDQAAYASDFRKITKVEFVNEDYGTFWLHFYADTAPTHTFNIVIQTQQLI